MFTVKLDAYDTPMTRMDSPLGTASLTGPTASGATRRRFWAVLRMTVLSILAVVVLFAAGFGVFATYVGTFSVPKEQASADAIIVLTGGEARLGVALDLLKSGKGKRLLISGVNPATGRNQLRVATGSDRKLFNCCVDFDYEALDTIGNAMESAKWVRKHAFDSVILVTNNYHMPRSLLELGRQTEAAVTPYPVVNTPLDGWRWLSKPGALRVLFTEYTKYLASMARGLLPAEVQESAIQMVQGGSDAG
jgi:uncharacterized SAM-binding protein YcdF (DUF218 family)